LPDQDAVAFAIRAKKVDAFLLRPLEKTPIGNIARIVHSNLDVRCGGSLEREFSGCVQVDLCSAKSGRRLPGLPARSRSLVVPSRYSTLAGIFATDIKGWAT
jgi:hypothetical protein